MARLSRRGWAQFSVLDHDPETGRTRVRADSSAFVLDQGPEAERKVCYMFLGWFAGALEAVSRDLGTAFPALQAEELHCAAEGIHDHCLFELRPAV
jgi:predicted hydrocarbon binding protein